ncbi:MAG: peptide deformylase [Cytophagales bacterium]|nr:MAG: peptide deformylase [Cytophagales bacterium]TAF60123.1 MAG: peptide deformylase [Cytophagales bacterium]
MIYPIVLFGSPVLRQKAQVISPETHPNLQELVASMYETMYHCDGVGLAAPQIGLSIRLFVIDTGSASDEENREIPLKKAFVNAEILVEEGKESIFKEGCLSIPNIREDVMRKPTIRIRYQDENWQTHEETFTGFIARVIQHEYDHIEGLLFTDRISSFRRTLLKTKLMQISQGKVRASYRTAILQSK